MNVFHCDHCQHTVFFENVSCLSCGHALAYLPDVGDMAALAPEGNGQWRSLSPASNNRRYRLCDNYALNGVCNWALPADAPHSLCRACRLTRVLPNQDQPGNLEAWGKLEVAKRRLVHSLLQLNLPLNSHLDDAENGLAFDFLSDSGETQDGGAVLTGHQNGVITINIAEADDLERERRRLAMREPYRTLLGHFRHEVGHYYWDLFSPDHAWLSAFRQRFGDEREDYAAALQRHYDQGPRADWQQQHVTSYASTHPWEDWAETWAHYLHMTDSLDTAAACGFSLRPSRSDEPQMTAPRSGFHPARPFDLMIEDWLALIYALNNLNRSMGLADGYPFVLAPPVIEKLRFVHDTVTRN
ncbi:MAG: putative zinc-binding peptidase [Polycyclovorans sp.]|jgi:hypothetical protein|nr:hypothetical protein [Polycyclovorans sp.]MBU0790568.1 putative zinc-binding peptidase [Gammaproteobacteria bacterium]MDP1542147.1 putative zinc-binding peptidase [Polycyclovorans sp.]MEC8848574.1 putative zinc-binding peptidase [Pseudomonadota bacterium]|tara:strand:+ start:37383 stop:38450 length:1068 start_codon:yes stop_codon:yes gene_type:complete